MLNTHKHAFRFGHPKLISTGNKTLGSQPREAQGSEIFKYNKRLLAKYFKFAAALCTNRLWTSSDFIGTSGEMCAGVWLWRTTGIKQPGVAYLKRRQTQMHWHVLRHAARVEVPSDEPVYDYQWRETITKVMWQKHARFWFDIRIQVVNFVGEQIQTQTMTSIVCCSNIIRLLSTFE